MFQIIHKLCHSDLIASRKDNQGICCKRKFNLKILLVNCKKKFQIQFYFVSVITQCHMSIKYNYGLYQTCTFSMRVKYHDIALSKSKTTHYNSLKLLLIEFAARWCQSSSILLTEEYAFTFIVTSEWNNTLTFVLSFI